MRRMARRAAKVSAVLSALVVTLGFTSNVNSSSVGASLTAFSIDKAGGGYRRTSYPTERRDFTPIPRRGIETAWVCQVHGTNATCYVQTSPGIGAPCLCCWNGQCYNGTIVDYS